LWQMKTTKIESRFPNWILTLSNVGAFVAAYYCFWGWRLPVLGIILVLSGAGSVLFHSCEQHKHPALPGLWHVTATQESFYLTLDRIAAVAAGLYVWYLTDATFLLKNPLVWAALGCNIVSELHFLGLVRSPAWDANWYPVLHSAWHVLVFTIPIQLLNG